MKVLTSLIIDDDLDDQEIFIMCINQIDPEIECRTSNDGVEAIELLETETEYVPDFIFLDVNMPKLNGIECLKILRKMERLNTSKIFLYSTISGIVEDQAKENGADGFIIKPAQTKVLKEKLSDIFALASE